MDHATTLIGSHIRRRSRKKPLKKMLARSTNIEYWTAWVSVCEIKEIIKPNANDVKIKMMRAAV